jgi:hypothetical protein
MFLVAFPRPFPKASTCKLLFDADEHRGDVFIGLCASTEARFPLLPLHCFAFICFELYSLFGCIAAAKESQAGWGWKDLQRSPGATPLLKQSHPICISNTICISYKAFHLVTPFLRQLQIRWTAKVKVTFYCDPSSTVECGYSHSFFVFCLPKHALNIQVTF